jgi:hypothetical protein
MTETADATIEVEPGTKLVTYGLLAEYDSPESLAAAAEKVRDAEYRKWDCHTPFPIHGLEHSMGLKDSILPWFTLLAGVTGLGLAIFLQWFLNGFDYPHVISGKPYWAWPANVPIAFEVTVLFAGVATVMGLFLLCKLPMLYHPLFRSRRFDKVTTDGFFISVEAADPKFDVDATRQLLLDAGATHVELVDDEVDDDEVRA